MLARRKKKIANDRKIKPGDKVYFPLYDDTAPKESEIRAKVVFDVGTKGIYFYNGSGMADFYGYNELDKAFFLTKKEAENELHKINHAEKGR